MSKAVRQLGAVARLEVWQQVKPAKVVQPVMNPAERHDAVGRVAAAQRARHKVGRVPTGRLPQTRQPWPTTLAR